MMSRWRKRRAETKFDVDRRQAPEDGVRSQGAIYDAPFAPDADATAAFEAALLGPPNIEIARAAYAQAVAGGADHTAVVAAAERAYEGATAPATEIPVGTATDAALGPRAGRDRSSQIAVIARALEDDALQTGAARAFHYAEREFEGVDDLNRVVGAIVAMNGVKQGEALPPYLTGLPLLGEEGIGLVRDLLTRADCADLLDGPMFAKIHRAFVDHYAAHLRLAAGMVLYGVLAGTFPEAAPSDKAHMSLAKNDILPMTWAQRTTALGL
jgi:hypothetical protein